MNASYELVRAIRGPIVLITLGLLFSLDQADRLGFERTWPILFIVFGVFKLVERLIAPKQIPPMYYPPPPTAGPWQPPQPPPPTAGPWQPPQPPPPAGTGGYPS